MEEVRPDWISWRCRKRLRRAHPRPLSSSPCVSTPSSVDLPASTLPRTARRRSMNCGQRQRIKPPFIYKWRADVGHNRELGHPFFHKWADIGRNRELSLPLSQTIHKLLVQAGKQSDFHVMLKTVNRESIQITPPTHTQITMFASTQKLLILFLF